MQRLGLLVALAILAATASAVARGFGPAAIHAVPVPPDALAALFRAPLGDEPVKIDRCFGLAPPAPPESAGIVAQTLMRLDSVVDPPKETVLLLRTMVPSVHAWSACTVDTISGVGGVPVACGMRVLRSGAKANGWWMRDAALTDDTTATARVGVWGCALGGTGEYRCDAHRRKVPRESQWKPGRCSVIWQE